MTHIRALLTIAFVSLALFVSSHVGPPPSLPSGDATGPICISVSASSVDVTGTSFCAYPCTHVLRCWKNGVQMPLTFNSTTTNTPHQYHTDTTWNVDLTGMNLQAGDVLAWRYSVSANDGPNRGQVVTVSFQSTVVP